MPRNIKLFAHRLGTVQFIIAFIELLGGFWLLLITRHGLTVSVDRDTFAGGMLIGGLGLVALLSSLLTGLLAIICVRIGKLERVLRAWEKVLLGISGAYVSFLSAVALAWLLK